MANSPQALKRVRQNAKRNVLRASQRAKLRTFVKKTTHAIAQDKLELAQQFFQQTTSVLDNSVHKGIIHKNKVARHKKRLNSKIKVLASKN